MFPTSKLLEQQVLILNQSYEPLSVCNVKKAVVMVYLGKAEIIEMGAYAIRSIQHSIPQPVVVRLWRFIRSPGKRIILSRKNVIKRDRFQCQYCAGVNIPMTVDHVIPKTQGGKDRWDNLVAACIPCNTKKGNRTPERAGMPLLRKPKKPNPLTFFQHFVSRSNTQWKPYLFMD